MDITKCQASICDASSVTDQKSQWNLQMFTQMLKEETVQHLDEEEIPQYTDEKEIPQCMNEEKTFCIDYMGPCKPLQILDCVDNSDCKFYVLDQVKKEFPEDESPQQVSSISSRLVIKNEELSQVIERHEFKQEHTEESFSLIKNEEIDYKQDPIIVKIETLEEHRVLDNCGDSGVHYDVLVTPQKVQCKLCDRTFNNRYNLLIHNNEHIKVVLNPTPVNIGMNELHKCKCCHEHFNSHDNMLAHVRDVHGNETHKSESYNEGIKLYRNKKNSGQIEYKCDLCERVYKSKSSLVAHTKKSHFDYGRMFECSCGKQFRTPHHLSVHKKRQHNPNTVIDYQQYQCDSCQKFFKTKYYLLRHIKSMHYDYGKSFKCSCGKRFRTPRHLYRHNQYMGCADDKNVNNEGFQCHICQKLLKKKKYLAEHIKSAHHYYGKTFECSCGKQFRTPLHLSQHKRRQHIPNDTIADNQQFQCDSCHKIFKAKHSLICHIKVMHHDYGKTFGCSCGKQFRTPKHLYQHKQQTHCTYNKNINKEGYQCHICKRQIKTKKYLTAHMNSIHYDYGKTFDCWCGKQFRTPLRLRRHEILMHNTNSENKYQCDSCGKIFKSQGYLVTHIKHIHYDYGKMFSCWCGKQFSNPMHLRRHESWQHNNTNVEPLKEQFQCDICQKLFKRKTNLSRHKRNIHYDYGKVFVCGCGKQFRTPLRLKKHKYCHKDKNKDTAGVDTNIAI